jgi:hypothetical protein
VQEKETDLLDKEITQLQDEISELEEKGPKKSASAAG